MSLSFKQFTAFQAAAGQSDDIFLAHLEEGLFKSDDERVEDYKSLLASKDANVRRDAERGLALLVKKNNLKAKALQAQHERARAKQREADDAKTKHAQAVNQADDEGSSKAWRDEQGSVRRGPKGTTGTYGTLGTHDFTARGGFNWRDERYRR